MKDDLEAFFRAQRRRIRVTINARCGKMEEIEEGKVDTRFMAVEIRGNARGHASGRKKPSMDDAQGIKGQRINEHRGKRQSVFWADLERKAGRLPAYEPEDEDDRGDGDE